jgi:hypothetical protein
MAFYFLANLVKNIWINRYLKSGWVIPFVGICLWLVALWSFLNGFVPVWSFGVTAIFCELIGSLIGSVLLMLLFGGRGPYAAWRLYELTEQQFFKFSAACQRSNNQEAAQKILKHELAFRLIARYESPFCRGFFKPSDVDIPKVYQYLKDNGAPSIQTFRDLDPAASRAYDKLQKLSDAASPR